MTGPAEGGSTADQQDPRCDYCGDWLSEHTPMQVESCLGDLYEQLNGPRMTQRRNDEGPGINDTGAQHAEALLLRRENDGSTQQDPRVDIPRDFDDAVQIVENWTRAWPPAPKRAIAAVLDAARPASPAPEHATPDSEVVRAHYGPGEKRLREDIRRYGLVRCLTAAAMPDHCSTPADAPREGDGIYDEIAELVSVQRWMDDEALARALGINVDAVIEFNQGDIEPAIADRIADLVALAALPAPAVPDQEAAAHTLRLRVVNEDLRKQLATLVWWEFGWTDKNDGDVRAAAYRAADAILADGITSTTGEEP